MRGYLQILLSFLFIISLNNYVRAQDDDNILKNGNWIKVKVTETGIYKLSYSFLKNAGISDFEKLVVIGRGGSMSSYVNNNDLPQVNQMPIYISSGEDNEFGRGDFILFYAQGPSDNLYDNITKEFSHRLNEYEDFATYLIGESPVVQSNITTISLPENITGIDVYEGDYFIYYEKNLRNLLKSGRNNVGEKFGSIIYYDYNLSIPNVIEGGNAIIKSHVLARGVTDSDFEFSINGDLIGETSCEKVNVTSFSGLFASSSIFRKNTTLENTNTLRISFVKDGSNVGWLDYFTVQTRRKLSMNKSYLFIMDSKTAGSNNHVRYNIKHSSSLVVWDVTDIKDVKQYPTVVNSGINQFTALADKLYQYVAFDPSGSFSEPELIGKINNTNLHNISVPEMLIVTVKDLKEEAMRLSEFHNIQGLTSTVVIADDIYNEFSSGQKHPIGIRDFVRYLYQKSPQTLKYLCLFGDGSYLANESVIPVWQTINSTEPAHSFVSDDFYGLLDEGEGEFYGDLDIGVGRIPVNTKEEAATVVDKIIKYKESKRDSWIAKTVFLADDGDYNEHISNTEKIIEYFQDTCKHYRVEKLFLDDFTEIEKEGKKYYPEVNTELNRLINDGIFLVNYIGHGNEKRLAHEQILTQQDIENWKNKDKLPLFVTATCDFSRFDNHEELSAGEQILLRANGGAVALFSTTRLVYSSPNFLLNKELIKQIFNKNNAGEEPRLGDIIRTTKNNSPQGSSMRNFSLIGDPGLTLNYPSNKVVLKSISDTLKAYGKVSISGEIHYPEGDINDLFEGEVSVKVYDKSKEYTTRGNDSQPYKYHHRKSLLFNGKASVNQGRFNCEIPVSSDIDITKGLGKMFFYAQSDIEDAYGSSDTIPVGGKENTIEPDNKGPVINMFINNDKFVYGGLTDNNPLLFARISDKSGINTTGNNTYHNITVTLDGSFSVILNQNFVSEVDDYTKGIVWYRFTNLEEGRHSVSLEVSDNYGNKSTQEISFVVGSTSKVVLQTFRNVPNPAKNYTDFYFEHNMPDHELDGKINIYNLSGQLVRVLMVNGIDNGYRFGPFRWNLDGSNGAKVERGIYIAELILRSPNGKVVKTSQKVVVATY